MHIARQAIDHLHAWSPSRVVVGTALSSFALASILLFASILTSPLDPSSQSSIWQVVKGPQKQRFECKGPVTSPAERQQPWCRDFALKLEQEVAVLDAEKGCDAVFYGDSITETWRGTDQGKHCPRCKGVPEVFKKTFGANRASEVLAVGGDQAMHLLWRLQHGQVFTKHIPQMDVVMIGTNDLGAASCMGQGEAPILQAANGTADRITEVISYLHKQNPTTSILILGILPRGSGEDFETRFNLPSDYSSAIALVNNRLEQLAISNVLFHFADCGPSLTVNGKLSPDLMPDALHPNAVGMQLLAECIAPFMRSHAGP